MIRVFAIDSIFAAERFEFHYAAGSSATQLTRDVWDRVGWSRLERVGVALGGKPLSAEEMDLPLADGVEILLVPVPNDLGEFLGDLFGIGGRPDSGDKASEFYNEAEAQAEGHFADQLLASGVVAVVVWGISYLLQEDPEEFPQDRGEDISPTYQLNIATEYRAGLTIPVVLGQHDVGGTMISTLVKALTSATIASFHGVEQVYAILALCQGPIYSIGGITVDANRLGGIGPASGQGTLPANIRINGNTIDISLPSPGVIAYTRLGNLKQAAIPDFPSNASTTEAVGEALNEKGAEAIHTVTNTNAAPISHVSFLFYFPGGCFFLSSSAQASRFPVKVRCSWRPAGTTGGWTKLGIDYDIGAGFMNPAVSRQPFAVSLPFPLTPPISTGVEFRVERLTATNEGGIGGAISTLTFRQIVYQSADELEYPGTALIGLHIEGSEALGGKTTGFINRVRGSIVRVWDAEILGGQPSGIWKLGEQTPTPGADGRGWYWVLPTGLYAGIWTYPPGMNPAWQAVELLTNKYWGLGRYVSDAQIDWAAWRDFADWCDRDVLVGAVNEAANQCSLVLDRAVPVWDALVRICSTGRGTPVLLGSQYSVRYNYSAAHGRGTNVVAAKAAVQLFTAANVEEFSATFVNVRLRPAVIIQQILSEDTEYAHETVSTEDPDGGFNDPTDDTAIEFRKITRDSFGVTRRTQATREALFRHKANSLIKSQVEFTAGPEAITLTVGDVFKFQHDWLRPFDTNGVAWRIYESSSASTFTLDHDVTLDGSKGYQLAYRGTDGEIGTATITASTSGTFSAGVPIPIDSPINVLRGAPVVFGELQEITQDYEVRNLSLEESLRRRVIGHEYHAEVYDDQNVGADLEWGGEEDVEQEYVPARSSAFATDSQTPAPPISLRILKTDRPGEHEITYQGDPLSTAREVRVWARLSDAVIPDEVVADILGRELEASSMDSGGVAADLTIGWALVGQSPAGRPLLTRDLNPLEKYDISLTVANNLGAWQSPDQGFITSSVVVDEFPPHRPFPPTDLRIAQTFEGNLITWEPADAGEVLYYEIRETNSGVPRWLGAQFVARTIATSIAVPPSSGDSYVIRSRNRSGLYSDLATVATPSSTPQNEVASGGASLGSWVMVDLDGNENDGLSISAGEHQGTATVTLALDYTAEARLVISVDTHWIDEATTLDDLEDEGWELLSGESEWRFLEGRDASWARPGVNFELLLDDLDDGRLLDDPSLDDLSVGGCKGSAGEHAACRIYVDYDGAGFEPYSPRRRVFSSVEIQLRLFRESETYQMYTSAVTAAIYTR